MAKKWINNYIATDGFPCCKSANQWKDSLPYTAAK